MKQKTVTGKKLANECTKHTFCTNCPYCSSRACADLKSDIYRSCSPMHVKLIMDRDYVIY